MSVQLHFVSHLRRGLARLIGEKADVNGVPQDDAATITIRVDSDGTVVERTFDLLGPGAITGFVTSEVVAVDPPEGSADHLPNLFPSIELKTPDLPWRHTPAQAHDENLMPWLVLVVVPERSGIQLRSSLPLPVLELDDANELPDLNQAWAWAHVQFGSDEDDLDTIIERTPDAIWSRLICPRFLEPDTAYLACVVPSFETGRLTGLGLSSDSVAMNTLAWTAHTTDLSLPVYYSWRFQTAAIGADFEELVRRLTPIALSPEVGVRALDVSDPGSDRLPNADVELAYEGALVSPQLRVPPWRNPHRSRFQLAMAALLGKATDSPVPAAGETYDPLRHDPMIAPPAYGLLASGVDDVPVPRRSASDRSPRWLAEANLDPRQRAVAGVGAEVVRRNQERLMANAWQQAIGVQAVNRLLNQTRVALEVGRRVQARLTALAPASVLQLSAGAHARLAAGGGATVLGVVESSALPRGSVSAALRRQMRPAGIFAKALRSSAAVSDTGVSVTQRFTERVVNNTSGVLRFADSTIPYGTVLSSEAVVSADDSASAPSRPAATDFDAFDATHGASIQQRLRQARTPAAARLRRRYDVAARMRVVERRPTELVAQPIAVTDSVAAAQEVLDTAQVDAELRPIDSVFGAIDHTLSGAGDVSGSASSFDLGALSATINAQFDPGNVLASRLRHVIKPASALGAEPVPAGIISTPHIDDPLYADVVRIDAELLLPGGNGLPDEIVGLAAVNATHVEAFLLGANYELSREMLWREYPTDLTSTWLRTFWDRADASGGVLGDIEPIAQWLRGPLGSHPAAGSNPSQVLVLIVKGELLRRYPDTLINAVPARWQLVDGVDVREEDPDAAVLSPVFHGRLRRNLLFIGFEFPSHVDVPTDVRGSPARSDANPGWYFVFEQPATRPQFGLDTAASDVSPALKYWKDLSWGDVRSGDELHVDLQSLSATLPYDHRGDNTWSETWADSAAAMARITLQRPVRMLVHADEMLDEAGTTAGDKT